MKAAAYNGLSKHHNPLSGYQPDLSAIPQYYTGMDQPYASGHQPIANPLNHGNEQRFDTQHQFDNQVMNNSLNSAPSATGVRSGLYLAANSYSPQASGTDGASYGSSNSSGASRPAFSQALDTHSCKSKRLVEFRRKDNLGIGARIKRSAGELTVLTEEQPAIGDYICRPCNCYHS